MNTTQSRKIMVALLLSLVALSLHLYLANKHYALKFGLGGGPSMCNINEKLNCDAVAASSYSQFLGVPLAVFGATAHFVLFLLLLIFRLGWTETREAVGRSAAWLSLLIALASVVMGSISALWMSAYCLFCMASYLISFINLYCIWSSTPEVFASLSEDITGFFTDRKWIMFLFLAVPAGAYLADVSIVKSSGFSQLNKLAEDKVTLWKSTPSQNIDLSKGLATGGGAAPRMTIVEFADFRCPHCRHAYPTLHSFAQSHPDVKLVFKVFPLDGVCNPALKEQGGDGISCRLAETVFCAEKVNQTGWQAHNYFFDHQEEIVQLSKVDDVLTNYCAANKVDCEALKTCVESNEIKDAIRTMAEEGKTLDVRGTPAIFVNGRILGLGQLIPVLELAYKNL